MRLLIDAFEVILAAWEEAPRTGGTAAGEEAGATHCSVSDSRQAKPIKNRNHSNLPRPHHPLSSCVNFRFHITLR